MGIGRFGSVKNDHTDFSQGESGCLRNQTAKCSGFCSRLATPNGGKPDLLSIILRAVCLTKQIKKTKMILRKTENWTAKAMALTA
jgi:hypothetical protein